METNVVNDADAVSPSDIEDTEGKNQPMLQQIVAENNRYNQKHKRDTMVSISGEAICLKSMDSDQQKGTPKKETHQRIPDDDQDQNEIKVNFKDHLLKD